MTRPLVLLHGFTGSPESWAPVVRELDQRTARSGGEPAPIFAPAALGHDGTPGPSGIDTFEAEIDRLAAAVRGRDLTRSHLAGYSMGGRLALGLLVRHPELFASATLIGASPGLPDEADRALRGTRDEEWARLLDDEGLFTFVAAWEALPLFETQAELSADRRMHQDRIRRGHDPRGLARSLRVAGLSRMPDYRPELPDVKIPVRLVVGETDAKFRALAVEMAAALPHATLTVVPGAGHNIVLERPGEVAELLREDMSR